MKFHLCPLYVAIFFAFRIVCDARQLSLIMPEFMNERTTLVSARGSLIRPRGVFRLRKLQVVCNNENDRLYVTVLYQNVKD